MNLFAYTFSFGNGFSATLSLEDGTQRSVNNDLAFPLFGVASTSPVFAPIASTYAGELMPDVVANLRYTGTWGGAQLSAALHQIRDVAAGVTTVGGVTVPVLNPITGLPNPTFADTDYGFAVAALGYANVPALGVGDTVWMIGNLYGWSDRLPQWRTVGRDQRRLHRCRFPLDAHHGCLRRSRSRASSRPTRPMPSPAASITTGRRRSRRTSSAPGCVSMLLGWRNTWCPRPWRRSPPERRERPRASSTSTSTRVGANVIWTPVKEFLIGVEALYIRVDPRERVAVPITTAAGDPTGTFRSTGSEDTWEGRLRVQRDF